VGYMKETLMIELLSLLDLRNHLENMHRMEKQTLALSRRTYFHESQEPGTRMKIPRRYDFAPRNILQ